MPVHHVLCIACAKIMRYTESALLQDIYAICEDCTNGRTLVHPDTQRKLRHLQQKITEYEKAKKEAECCT